MPNWCANQLTVTATTPDDLTHFINTATYDGALNFSKTVPVAQSDADVQHDAWGTKWDISEAPVDRTDLHVTWYFDTAWSPPITWIEQIAPRYPKLTFALGYDEPGMGFAGLSIYRNGRLDPASFDTQSIGWLACTAGGCDEYVDGFYPWEPNFPADPTNLPAAFCADHILAAEVYQAEYGTPIHTPSRL